MQNNTAFYTLEPAVDTEETGPVFPQVHMVDGYNFKAPDSVHHIRHNKFPDFTPDLRFRLREEAKLTDMLSQAAVSGHGFLISDGIRHVLEQFTLPPHRYFKATIDVNGILHDNYFWVHFNWKDSPKFINFPKSQFFIRRFSKNLGPIAISSIEDFWIKKQELGTMKLIDYSRITISSTSLDVITIPFKGDIFISTYLNQKLLESNISGIQTHATDKILIQL